MLFLLFLTAGIAENGNSQNIIGNNGFESNTSSPNGYGQWPKCTGWNNVNMFTGFAWPYASPDYLAVGGSGGAGLPNSIYATVNPYSGNAVMGFIGYYAPQPDFREYVARPLNSAMVVGNTYNISFFITNGSANWYSGGGCNHIGVKFSIGPLTQSTHEPLNIIPDCEVSTKLWSTTWTLLTFSFTPTLPYNNITIGNFYNDLNTSFAMYGSGGSGAYYFIDELIVESSTTLPVELLSFTGKNTGSENLLEWSTASEMHNDYFSVEKSNNGRTFEPFGSVKGKGNSNTPQYYFFADKDAFTGVNYYRLKQVDDNGAYTFSEIIKIYNSQDENVYITSTQQPAVFNLVLPGSDNGTVQYDVYNSSAKLVHRSGTKMIPGKYSTLINLESQANGIYMVEILFNGRIIKKKIVKL